MARSKARKRWTVVQHSGFGYGGKAEFEQALEVREVGTLKDQNLVLRAGGKLFDSWEAANQYEEDVNVGAGFHPRVPGTFSDKQIDGLKIYTPPEE